MAARKAALDTPLVSVVVATYNCAGFLREAIGSVLNQTYRRLELHVVDDGSTDHTADVIQEFASDPRLHYHFQTNRGQTNAKNRGIAMSRGEFVAFCDADDRWLPSKLAVQIPLFHGRPDLGVVYTRSSKIDEAGRTLASAKEPRSFFKSGRVTVDLFKTNFVPFGTAVIRKSCLDEMGAFDERYRMGIDWELWLRLSTRYEFLFADEVTYVYRVWDGQMSRNWEGRYENCFRIMRDFESRHAGLLSPAVVREAWADSFVQRGRQRASWSRRYLQRHS